MTVPLYDVVEAAVSSNDVIVLTLLSSNSEHVWCLLITSVCVDVGAEQTKPSILLDTKLSASIVQMDVAIITLEVADHPVISHTPVDGIIIDFKTLIGLNSCANNLVVGQLIHAPCITSIT